jgi:hypothetical protein
MRDLRDRFEALDLLEAPYQWPEIEQRAASPDKVKTPSWLHGAWVAAASAASVLVFAGGIVAGRWLLGAGSVLDAALGESGPLQPATPEDVRVLALVVAGASGGFVMLTAALTLLWRWRGRNGQSSKMKTRGEVMETMEKTIEKPERTIETVTRNNRWLILAVVVLFAVIVAAGAWLVIDNLVTSDVEHVVQDASAAMNAGDIDAFMALHTSDIVLTTVLSGSVTKYEGADEVRAWFNGLFDTWYTETTGEVVVSGDYVTYPETVGWDDLRGYEGIHVNRVEDGLIAESLFIGRSKLRSGP